MPQGKFIIARDGHSYPREKWMKPIFIEMFRIIGQKLTGDFVTWEDWFDSRGWKFRQEVAFREWLRSYLRHKQPWKSFSNAKLEGEIQGFIDLYGWRRNDITYE